MAVLGVFLVSLWLSVKCETPSCENMNRDDCRNVRKIDIPQTLYFYKGDYESCFRFREFWLWQLSLWRMHKMLSQSSLSQWMWWLWRVSAKFLRAKINQEPLNVKVLPRSSGWQPLKEILQPAWRHSTTCFELQVKISSQKSEIPIEISCFSSVPTGNYRDSGLNYAKTLFCRDLSNSSCSICYLYTVRRVLLSEW